MGFTTSFYQALGTVGGQPAQILGQTSLSTPVVGALAVFGEALPYANRVAGTHFSACLEEAQRGNFLVHPDMVTIVSKRTSSEQQLIADFIRLSGGPTARLFQSDQQMLAQARRAVGIESKSSPVIAIAEILKTRAEQLRTVAIATQKAKCYDVAADLFRQVATEESKRVRHFREARNPAGLADALFQEGSALEAEADALKETIAIDNLEFGRHISRWIELQTRIDLLYSEAILRFRLTDSSLQEANLLFKRANLLMALGFLYIGKEKYLAVFQTAFTEFVKARFVFDQAREEEPPNITNSMAIVEQQIKSLEKISILPYINPSIERAKEIVQWIIRQKGRIVVLTGAGISAESGIPTFRDAPVLWEGENILDVINQETLTTNPQKFWRFLRFAMGRLEEANPNPGHQALVTIEKALGVPITIVTQNVDNLHRRAGSQEVLEIHGNLFRLKCTNGGCDFTTEEREVMEESIPHCPQCQSLLRPDIILFNEYLPSDLWRDALQAAREADLFIVIGTSGVVWPASDLATVAGDHGAFILQINLTANDASPNANIFLEGKSGEILPQLVHKPE